MAVDQASPTVHIPSRSSSVNTYNTCAVSCTLVLRTQTYRRQAPCSPCRKSKRPVLPGMSKTEILIDVIFIDYLFQNLCARCSCPKKNRLSTKHDKHVTTAYPI